MLNYKSQISNNKSQTNPKIQIQMFKTGSLGFRSLEFGTCLIFGAWNLVLEIYLRRNVARDPWSALVKSEKWKMKRN